MFAALLIELVALYARLNIACNRFARVAGFVSHGARALSASGEWS